jgi:hypothetical protein
MLNKQLGGMIVSRSHALIICVGRGHWAVSPRVVREQLCDNSAGEYCRADRHQHNEHRSLNPRHGCSLVARRAAVSGDHHGHSSNRWLHFCQCALVLAAFRSSSAITGLLCRVLETLRTGTGRVLSISASPCPIWICSGVVRSTELCLRLW